MAKIIFPLTIFVWWIAFKLQLVAEYILPNPAEVFKKSFEIISFPETRMHLVSSGYTLILGVCIGVVCSFILGYLSAKRKWIYKTVVPSLSVLQSLPVVVYAPLLLVFMGNNFYSRTLITTLISFFPVLIGTFEGFSRQNIAYVRLFQTMRASRWQKWWYLDFPMALPSIFAGIKIALPISLVGVLVAEFLGTDKGIGVLLQIAQNSFDTVQTFALVLIIATVSYVISSLVNAFERFGK